jgi:K+-sensing histidine kinase KdpD
VNSMTHEFAGQLHQTLLSHSGAETEITMRCELTKHVAELSDFVHDLRQPLSTIECLTSYLELVCTDVQTRSHLQRIQDMVTEANHILERAFADNTH